MMQWTPYGTTADELKEHIRTFATVFPHVIAVRGSAGYGFYMLGSMTPITLDPEAGRSVLERPGVLEDISDAFDSPRRRPSMAGSRRSVARRGSSATRFARTRGPARSSPTTSRVPNISCSAT